MRRPLINLIFGMVLALTAVLMVNKYADTTAQSLLSQTTKIVVAVKDLNFGTTLLPEHLEIKEWPTHSVPEGAFTNMGQVFADEGKKGKRVILHTLYKGEPLLQKKVSGFGDKSTLSRKVSEDKRAFSIRIDDVSGVAGFLLPGDRVDILLTRKSADTANLVTDVILENIVILGIDQLSDERRDKPAVARTATVEVTTNQAQRLALAQQTGTLNLALRNYNSNNEDGAGRVSVGDLVSKSENTGAWESIRIRRGVSLDQMQVPTESVPIPNL